MTSLIDDMAAHMRLANFRPNSISAYTRCVRDLARRHPGGLAGLATGDLLEFLRHRREVDHISGSFQRIYTCAFRYLYGEVLGRPDVARDLPTPRVSRRRRARPYVPSRDEVARMMGAASSARDRAFLSLAYSTGMRVSELVRLQTDHIDARGGLIRVVDGKGGRSRVVPLSPALLHTLRGYWAEVRPAAPWMFTGRDPAAHLSISGGQDLVRRAVKRAGLSRAISVHCLRHACATHMLEDGLDVLFVQRVLGHAHLTTTVRYLWWDEARLRHAEGPLDRLFLRGGGEPWKSAAPSVPARLPSSGLPPAPPLPDRAPGPRAEW